MEGEVLYRCGKQVVRGRKSGRNAARVCEISKWGWEGAGGGGTKERQIVGSDKKDKLTRRQMTEAKRKLFKESCIGRGGKIERLLSGNCFKSITLLLRAI